MDVAAKTLLQVFLPGLPLTPRKLGTTRLIMHPDTDVPFEEHVNTVREERDLYPELANLMSHGMRHPGNVLLMCQRVF